MTQFDTPKIKPEEEIKINRTTGDIYRINFVKFISRHLQDDRNSNSTSVKTD